MSYSPTIFFFSFTFSRENSIILEAQRRSSSCFTRNEAAHIGKCHPFPFLRVHYVRKSKRVVQKAKILSTKVSKPHRYKNIHKSLVFVCHCMIYFITRIVSASQYQPCCQSYLILSSSVLQHLNSFHKHTPPQKANSEPGL